MKKTSKGLEELILFFEKNEEIILKDWYLLIKKEIHDKHQDKVVENSRRLYEIIKSRLANTMTEDDLEKLAYKVAKERVEANSNIGNFVYNVNIGRSFITKQTFVSDIRFDVIQAAIEIINESFDHFTYLAVSQYTLLKERQLEEKNLVITQSHKDKLSLLGQMSSSFVHEFRNPLTSVIGFIKLLKTENPRLKYIDIIEHELDQLKFRITQFLHTSKNEGAQEKRKEIVSIHLLLDNIIHFLYPSIVDIEVNVSTNYESDTEIIANKNEIKQVFLNILMNSIDAINKKEKPRNITVSTTVKNTNVIISISNNGPRIPDDTIDIIFEPFYTTKELGTGIGLFVCRKIIEKHNGTISCVSNNETTSFIIQLPLHQK